MQFNCKKINKEFSNCDFNIKKTGASDVCLFNIDGNNKNTLNWTEISIPEILSIPNEKPNIESIDQIFVTAQIKDIKLIETPISYKTYKLYHLSNDLLKLIKDALYKINNKKGYMCELFVDIDDLSDSIIDDIEDLNLKHLVSTIVNLLDNIIDKFEKIQKALSCLENRLCLSSLPAHIICKELENIKKELKCLLNLISSLPENIDNIIREITNSKDNLLYCNTNSTKNLIDNIVCLIKKILKTLNVDCTPSNAFEILCNLEGTCLTGRKLIIKGYLEQKIVYTAEVLDQSVHSAHFKVPFTSFIVPYAKFENAKFQRDTVIYDPDTNKPRIIQGYLYKNLDEVSIDLCEDFFIEKCIEDIFIYKLDKRNIFKNITLFLKAKPITCP